MSETTQRLQEKIDYYTELSNRAGRRGNNLLANKFSAMAEALYEEAILIELPVTPPEKPEVDDAPDEELAVDLGNIAKALANVAKDVDALAKKVQRNRRGD